MAANGISTLTIASGTTLTKNVNPPHSNTEIVPPYSAIWSLNYSSSLGATNDVSYKLYVTSLGIGSALTLTSHQTGDFSVTAGNFLYDEYGTSIGIIKGNTTIDNYMAKAAAVCGSLSNTIITAATYKGTWNAFTNTPTLTDGVGTLGDAYDTTTAGTSGAYPAYTEQDWRIYDGAAWQRVAKTTTTQWTITPATGGLADKEARQTAKLDIAQAKREGRVVAVDGTITGAIDSTKPYYRARDTYDITQLPTQYSGNAVVDNANTGGLVTGRPWVSYSVAPRANSVDEGSGLGTVFDITTINVANGTTLYYTVTGSVAGADFVSGSLPSGSFAINSNAGTVSFDLKADALTEGPENYALQIRTGSTSGRVVETSSLVTVNDTSLTASGDTAGLYRTTYTGYFADNPAFFATATVSSAAVNLSPIGDGDPGFEPFSVQLLGYFKPTTTETHTFFLTSDDASFMWLGATAVTGFTTGNAFINNGTIHGSEEVSASIALTAGVYYPIRIQMGDNSGGDVLDLNYSTPTIAKTTNVAGKIFYSSATNGL